MENERAQDLSLSSDGEGMPRPPTDDAPPTPEAPHTDEEHNAGTPSQQSIQPGVTPEASPLAPPAERSVRGAGAGPAGTQRADIDSKLEDLFPYYGNGTAITATDLVELLGELGFSGVDVEDIIAMVIDADAITLPEATEVSQRLLQQTNVNEVRLMASGVNIVQKTPWEYIKMKLTCSTQPHTHYKIDWDAVAPGPSVQLQGAVALALVLCGVLIILTVALEWYFLLGSSEYARVENAMIFSGTLASQQESTWTAAVLEHRAQATFATGIVLDGKAAARALAIDTSAAVAAGIVKGGVSQVAGLAARARVSGLARFLTVLHAYDMMAVSRGTNLTFADVSRVAQSNSRVRAYLSVPGVDIRVLSSSGSVLQVPSASSGSACNANAGLACNAANTPCFALQESGTLQPGTDSVFAFSNVRSFNGNTAEAVGTTLSSGIKVCAFVESSALAVTFSNAAVSVVNTPRTWMIAGDAGSVPATVGEFGSIMIRVAALGSTGSAMVLDTVSNRAALAACVAPQCTITTSSPGAMLQDCATAISKNVALFGTNVGLMSSVPERYFASPTGTLAVVSSLPQSNLASLQIADAVRCVNEVNALEAATLPAEVMLSNAATLTSSLTKLRSTCPTTCDRFDFATVAQRAASATSSAVSVLQQNYALQPVVAAAYALSNVSLVLITETRLLNVRTKAQAVIIGAVNSANRAAHPLTIECSRLMSTVPAPVFATDKVCDASVLCVQHGDTVLYRNDCSDCEPIAQVDATRAAAGVIMESDVTPDQQQYCRVDPQRVGTCSRQSRASLPLYGQYLANVLDREANRRSSSATVSNAFNDPDALSALFFSRNLSLQVSVYIARPSFESNELNGLYLAFGVAPSIIIFMLIVEIIVARIVLQDIEQEWSQYTHKIQQESATFAEMVVDIFPIQVAERIMKGSVRISDAGQFTFMFVNMHQFEALYRSKMEPSILGLFVSYYYLMMSNIAQHFDLYRVRTFGDTVLIVGGIADDTRDLAVMNRVCHRTLQAASVIIEIFAYMWTHTPSHVPCLRDMSTLERSMTMPSVKIGIHCGPAMLIVEPASRGPPVCDVVGQHVGVAHAATQAAHVNTINVTEPVLTAVASLGNQATDMYQFKDASRRIATRVGSVRTQLMIAANVPVPTRVAFALGVRRATTRAYFGEPSGNRGGKGGTNDGGSSNEQSEGGAK